MSKLSQLKIKKMREMEYNQFLKEKLVESRQRKKEGILEHINYRKVRYYDFEHDSGGEQLCLMLQENALNNNKERDTLNRLTKTLLRKGWNSWLNDGRVVRALAMVGKYEQAWVQDLENYKPISHNPYREFAHLLRHLFAQYSIPAFLDTAFYYQNDTHIRWYLHLARGGSVRTLDNMPLQLTQKMRHYFLQAPPEASIPQALRYAQVMGLGGSRRLARHVMHSHLSNQFEHEPFWESVLRFLVQNPMLDICYIQPILDFIQWIKFEPQGHFSPVEPNFSMKGRSIPALLNLVEVWEKERKQAQTPKLEANNWIGVLLPDFEWIEGEGHETAIYRIKQIRTIYALREEGRAMNHCVATYYSSCVAGRSSIWSMTKEDAYGNTKRLITIELGSKLCIQQARGNSNQYPTVKAYSLLEMWAEKHILPISNDVKNYVNYFR